jgi:hypothetical protein
MNFQETPTNTCQRHDQCNQLQFTGYAPRGASINVDCKPEARHV